MSDRKRKSAETNGATDKTAAGESKRSKVEHLENYNEFLLPLAVDPRVFSVPLLNGSFSWKVHHSYNQPQPELLLQSAGHPSMNYTARESALSPAWRACQRYLAVYDPNTKQWQACKARKVVVSASTKADDEEARKHSEEHARKWAGSPAAQSEEDVDTPIDPKTRAALRQDLGMAFGTKKAQKALSSIARNAISSGTLRGTDAAMVKETIKENPESSAILDSVAATIHRAPTRESLHAAIDEARPRPRNNPNATKAEEVYPLEVLINNEVLKEVRVNAWIEAVQNGEEIQSTSRFVVHRVEQLVSENKVAKLRVLKYILLLLNFYKGLKSAKNGGRRLAQKGQWKENLDAPGLVVDAIKKQFVGKDEMMSKWHIDNFVTHLAALTLYVDDWETDIYDIREDMSMKPADMQRYFAELGVIVKPLTEAQRRRMNYTYAQAAAHKIGKLELPLQLPRHRTVPLTQRR